MKLNTFLSTVVVSISMFATSAVAQMSQGEILYEERRGAWNSFVLKFPDYMNYRATVRGNDPSVLLTFDVYSETCKSNISFIFPFDAPLEENREQVEVHIDARVDSGRMFYLSGIFSGVMGDSFGQISLLDTNEYGELLEAMIAGRTARFRVTNSASEHLATISFSLMGFTYSANRLAYACQGVKAETEAAKRRRSPVPDPSPTPIKNSFQKLI